MESSLLQRVPEVDWSSAEEEICYLPQRESNHDPPISNSSGNSHRTHSVSSSRGSSSSFKSPLQNLEETSLNSGSRHSSSNSIQDVVNVQKLTKTQEKESPGQSFPPSSLPPAPKSIMKRAETDKKGDTQIKGAGAGNKEETI